MNLSGLPSRLLTPATEAGAVQLATGRNAAAQLNAASGNQLLGLNVWGNTSAAERLLSTSTISAAPPITQLDQLAHHILAPLG